MTVTAGTGPAAGSSLDVGPDPLEQSNGYISASEAARLHGVNRHALVDLVKAGLVRGSIDENDGRRPYRFDPDELAVDLERLPTCEYEGCDRPALGSCGGCTKHRHILARRARVAELRRERWSTSAIAAEEGISHETARQDLKALELDTSQKSCFNGLISASEAERRFDGVDRHTLVAAVKAGRVRGMIIEKDGRPLEYRFDVNELDEDLARLPTCRYPDCDRPALGPSGGCEAHGHVFAGDRARGKKRPDIGPKISRAKRGKSRPDMVEPMKAAWRRGGRAARAVIERNWRPLRGRTKRDWKNRWNGLKGGRPRASETDPGYSEKVAKLLDLRAKNGRVGERVLAARSGLSRRQVRAVLSTVSDHLTVSDH